MESGNKGQGKRKWVGILDCPIIDVLIILARTQFTTLLSNKKEPTHLRGL
jgi:hypothetical protein